MHGGFGGRKGWFSPIPSSLRNLRLLELLPTTPSGGGGFTSYYTVIEGPCMELEVAKQGGERERTRKTREGLVQRAAMQPGYRSVIVGLATARLPLACLPSCRCPASEGFNRGREVAVGLEREKMKGR